MNETQWIDDYLRGEISPETKLLLEARLLIDSDLKEKMFWQEKTYALVKNHGRQQLKREIEKVQQRLFSETRFESFRKKIQILFS
jgi:hypothetical protein